MKNLRKWRAFHCTCLHIKFKGASQHPRPLCAIISRCVFSLAKNGNGNNFPTHNFQFTAYVVYFRFPVFQLFFGRCEQIIKFMLHGEKNLPAISKITANYPWTVAIPYCYACGMQLLYYA